MIGSGVSIVAAAMVPFGERRRLGVDDGLVKYGWKARVHVEGDADLDPASGHEATGETKS